MLNKLFRMNVTFSVMGKAVTGFLAMVIVLLLSSPVCFSQDTIHKDGFNKFYYPNGKLSSEGTLKNGKPDGYWKSYNDNGTVKSEGNRKNFELDSLWKFYNPDGKLMVEINYRAGKKNGMKTTFLDKETMKENFRDDVKEGFTRYYFPDGKLKQEIPFVKGLEQGFAKEYASDGTIITLTEYKRGFIVDRQRINRKDGNGRKQGRWYTFYDNGTLKAEVTYRDGMKNGYLKEYAENGDLLRINKFIDDEIQNEAAEIQKLDIQNEYYPNGKVKVSAMFRNGIPEGVRREYGADGNVEKAYLYKNGVIAGEGIVKDDGNRDGPWKDFYAGGSLKAEGNYVNGIQTGEWKYYHQNGKIEQTGRFGKQGKYEGTWKWYFDNGQLLKEENYRNGLRDGVSAEYDETGKVIEEGEFVNGNEDGPWFELTGDNFIRGTYRDGQRSGMWYNFYLDRTETKTDSICYFKGSFIDDNPNGKHIYYWENGKVKDEGSYVNGRKEGDWYKYNFDGTLFMVITYKQGVETRYDGVKIKPAYEKEEE
jgi:antitoxin component YwqK of YwqJK toxin-antitoxin module